MIRRRAVAPEGFPYGAAISLCDGPAGPAGTTSLSSDAEPGHRAGVVHTQRRDQPGRRARSPSRHDVSGERRGAAPSGRLCSPAVRPSACTTGERRRQAQRPCRAMRLHAIAPEGFRYSAALRLRGGPAAPAGLTSLLSEAGSRHREVSTCEGGPAAPAGRTPPTFDAMQRPRVEGCHVLCGRQRVHRGPAASAGLAPHSSVAGLRRRVGGHHALGEYQRARRGSAASADRTPLTSDVKRRARLGGYHVRCSRQRVQRGPAASAGITHLTSDASQRPRVGFLHALCCSQPGGCAGAPPGGGGGPGGPASRGPAARLRCPRPSGRSCLPTAPPSASAKSASGTCGPCFLGVRGRVRP